MLLFANVSVVLGDFKNINTNQVHTPIDLLSRNVKYIIYESIPEYRVSNDVTYNIDDSLVPNPSFEDGDTMPEGWKYDDLGMNMSHIWDAADAHSGEKSIGISSPDEKLNTGEWWYTTDLIPVDFKANNYEFSVWIKFLKKPFRHRFQYALCGFEMYDKNKDFLEIYLILPYYTPDWEVVRVYIKDYLKDSTKNNTRFIRITLSQIYLGRIGKPDTSVIVRFDDVFLGITGNQPPEKPVTPIGPTSGDVGVRYTYQSFTIDPDDDKIYYMFSWGDGNYSEWLGPYSSEQSVSASHIWTSNGSYSVRVKAIDDPNGDGDISDGIESVWSDPLKVNIPKKKSAVTFDKISSFDKILVFNLHIFQSLQKILNLRYLFNQKI